MLVLFPIITLAVLPAANIIRMRIKSTFRKDFNDYPDVFHMSFKYSHLLSLSKSKTTQPLCLPEKEIFQCLAAAVPIRVEVVEVGSSASEPFFKRSSGPRQARHISEAGWRFYLIIKKGLCVFVERVKKFIARK